MELKELGAKLVSGIWSQEESKLAKFEGVEITDESISIRLVTKQKWVNLTSGAGSDEFGEYWEIDKNLALFIPHSQVEAWNINTFAYNRVDKYDRWILFERDN